MQITADPASDAIEEGHYERPVLLGDGADGIVQHDPFRRVQRHAGTGQALLLIERKLPVPPRLSVQGRQEIVKTNPPQRILDCAALEAAGFGRIGDRRAQCSRRQVRLRRHEHHGIPRRQDGYDRNPTATDLPWRGRACSCPNPVRRR